MKKFFLMAAFIATGLSMMSCTAEALGDAEMDAPAPIVADGEPIVPPIKPPPPPPPFP